MRPRSGKCACRLAVPVALMALFAIVALWAASCDGRFRPDGPRSGGSDLRCVQHRVHRTRARARPRSLRPPMSSTTLAPLAASPGSPDSEDPYFPASGNGGYDVQSYAISLDIDPTERRASPATRL